MAKLISNKVKKVSSDQADPNRYEFLSLEHAEPDLGVPVGNGYFLVSNTDGSREWTLTIDATTLEGNTASDLQDFAIQQANDAFSNAVTYVDEQTTDTIEEGNTNLYFTQDRARISVSSNGDLSYDSNTGVFSVTTYKSSDFDIDFSNKTTDDLNEGNTNLYYLDSRVDSHLSTANGLDYNSGLMSSNQDISSGANVTFTKVAGLSSPFTSSDAVNKLYVDDLADTVYSNAISYTDTEIAALVNTAPGVLDTLNELASAINDDPNFANSVAGQISTAYSNAVSVATDLAANAFSNAVAYVDSQTTDTIEEGNTNLYWIEAPNDGEQYVRQDESWVTVDIPEGYDSNNFSTDFASKTTDDLTEGNTNLYFTENRVVDAVENNTVNTVSVESNLIVPVGNSDSRPANAVVGMIRFNSEFNNFEGYNGTQWVQFSTTFGFQDDVDLMDPGPGVDLQGEDGEPNDLS